MRMARLAYLGIISCSLTALGVGPCTCGGKTTRPDVDLVTIEGIVLNIDAGGPAVGVRVTLLGTAYSSSTPTGTGGEYSIQVPRGTNLLLYTDDFSPGTDAWFPFINVDMPSINVDNMSAEDQQFWPIHACPQTQAPAPGSVAIWDHYLANVDDQTNGDIFAARSCKESGGIISILHAGCEGNTLAFYDSMQVAMNRPGCPVGHMKIECFGGDPLGDPSCVYPASRDATDMSGWVTSFCDSMGRDTSLTLTFDDLKAGRSLMWPPFKVPVRRGTITLVWAAAINGVAGKHFKEVAQCAGLLGPVATSLRPVLFKN